MHLKMRRVTVRALAATLSLGFGTAAIAQGSYKVASIKDAGSIIGTVKWSGPVPKALTFPVTKDSDICDPESIKKIDLERLIVGPQGGVENTVVFLKDIHSGKAMDIPQSRRSLDQKRCRYEPHVLLVPRGTDMQMQSSDATLHTVHMEGAATYNLPFPFANQVISRSMQNAGLVTLKCNGGHVWMNAEVFVIDHPYYAVTDESGRFELSSVPPGEYEIVAWHEGWHIIGHQASFDVLTQRKVDRPLFTGPRTWEKSVTVSANANASVDFTLAEE